MKNFSNVSKVVTTLLLFLIIGAMEVVKTEAAVQDVKLNSVITIGGASNQSANCITIDSSGNNIVSGVFNSGVDFDPGANSTIFSPTGLQDGFIAKYSATEELVWAKHLRTTTGSSSINVRKHAVDRNGNIVIIGEFKGSVDFDPSSNNQIITANVALAGFYAKYSSTGDLVFAKKFDTINAPEATCYVNDLYIDGVGRIYMTGSTTGPIDLDAGPAALTKIPRVWDDLWFELVDQNGDLIDATVYSGTLTSTSKGTGITLDDAGNIYVGVVFTGLFDADPSNNNTLLTNVLGEDVAVLKFSDMSTFAYAKQFESSTGDVSINDVLVVKNSNNISSIFIGGNYTNSVDLDPDNGNVTKTSQGSTDGYLVKLLASNGSFESGFSFGGSGADKVNSMAYDSWQQSILVGGNFSSLVDFDHSSSNTFKTSNGGLDNYFASYSSTDLSLNFVKSIGGTGKEVLASVFYQPAVKKVGVAGSFENTVDFDPSEAVRSRTSTGIDNFWLSGFDHYITATIENDTIWGIRPTSFGVSANVISDGNNAVTQRGFVYSKSADSVTIELGSSVLVGSGVGNFGTNIRNLSHSTTYYYRAFAKNDLGYVYSTMKSFTTLTPYDTLSAFTAEVTNSKPASVQLNWTLPTNKIRANYFIIVRKDFGVNGNDTTGFRIISVVNRDSLVSDYSYIDNNVNPHRAYEYDVVPSAILVIGPVDKPIEDKVKVEESKIMRVIPTDVTVGTMNEIRDSIRNINFSWIISNFDSTTSKIYVEYGSGSNPSSYAVIDSISRLTLANGGTHRISKLNGQNIQNGIHTIRLRAATTYDPFAPGTASSITFNVDTLKYSSAPIVSTCKDSSYSYTPSVKNTTLGSVFHSIVNPPSGVSFNNTTGVISWTPQSNGSYAFKTIITSSYNSAIRDTQSFNVLVTTCQPPNHYNVKCMFITGGVIESNNQDISNAKVTAFRTDQQLAPDMIMSFEAPIVNNAYSLNLPAGNYKLQFSGVNYATKWHSNATSLQDAQTVNTVCNTNQVIDFNNITSTTGTTNISFSGRVTSSTGANLVASIRFIPVNSVGQIVGNEVEVTSTTNGTFSANVPDDQIYHVYCSSTLFNAQYFDKAPSLVQATTVSATTQNKNAINFVLNPLVTTQYSMNGIIEDANGKRLEGFVIAHRIKDEQGTILTTPEIYSSETAGGTTIDGTWNMTDLKQGTYIVLVVPKDKKHIPGYVNFQSALAPRNWKNATEIPITTQQITPLPTIRLEGTDGTKGIHSWTGNIYNNDAGILKGVKQVEQPSSTITEPGVIIMLNDQNGKVVDYSISSNNGIVNLTNLELGLFEYETSKVGFLPGTGQIEVVEEPDSTGQVVVNRDPNYIPPTSVLDTYSDSYSFINPNPVSTNYQIRLEGAEGDAEVTVVDYLGRIRYLQNYVLNGSIFEATLSAKDLEQGSYKVIVRSGRKTAVTSLVIRR